jgi:hypothetical protein
MKIKLLIVLSLSAFLLLTGCRGDANTNTTTNANRAANTVNMSTPVAQTNESAATDTVMKNKVESALKAKGFNDVTVDATTTPASLRGTVPKGKMAEAIQTAQEAAGKPLNNQITEK